MTKYKKYFLYGKRDYKQNQRQTRDQEISNYNTQSLIITNKRKAPYKLRESDNFIETWAKDKK